MVNKSKNVGTAGESAVVRVLIASGWPNCERRALTGSQDRGDVAGVPGFVIEVKAGKAAETASDAQVVAWLEETETERHNDNAAYGVLVMKKKGVGHENAGRWTAVMWSDAYAHLLGLESSTAAQVAPYPVRMTLDNLITTMHGAGWGVAA
jgi:hypothetical protein